MSKVKSGNHMWKRSREKEHFRHDDDTWNSFWMQYFTSLTFVSHGRVRELKKVSKQNKKKKKKKHLWGLVLAFIFRVSFSSLFFYCCFLLWALEQLVTLLCLWVTVVKMRGAYTGTWLGYTGLRHFPSMFVFLCPVHTLLVFVCLCLATREGG